MSVKCGECEEVIYAPALCLVISDSQPPHQGFVVCSTCVGKLSYEEIVARDWIDRLQGRFFWVHLETSPIKSHRCCWDSTEPVRMGELPLYGISTQTMQAKFPNVYMNISLRG